MKSKAVILLVAIGVAVQANAQFTSVSESGAGFTSQSDQFSLLNNYFPGSGTFFANDPLTTNYYAGDSATTMLSFTATSTISSNYLEMDGYYYGQAATHFGNPNGAVAANAQGYDEMFFTSSGLTLVTVQALNASSSSSGYITSFSEINVDGTYYQFSPGNMFSSFTIGAGSHYMWYEAACTVYSGVFYGTDSSSTISTDFRLTASTVPEPASMILIGMGALAVLRRRRTEG